MAGTVRCSTAVSLPALYIQAPAENEDEPFGVPWPTTTHFVGVRQDTP